ncbi:DUF4157 domain-containing protein [Rhodanobacter sp. MP7CTX1]|uniref:eCIS core domain-containing protein n=1 Tax=Rhodanobacter sp. MP7CTX1 TaxID=2723084 RepID=UPI0017FCA964|nr:hypothetical protein [Rhodanobacter sp. MP7CTX1]
MSTAVKTGVDSSSKPLDASTRAFMEPRFGWDFSKVRVHTDSSASSTAQSLQARAYTIGNDIVFNQGQFHPTSAAGQSLLAHELAHTMQQQDGSRDVRSVGRIDDRTEQQADHAAWQALSNQGMNTPPTVARDASDALRRTPIHTWGGDFDVGEKGYTETFQEGAQQPGPDAGRKEKIVRSGALLHLKFSPDKKVVDAQEIAFVQAITSFRNDQPFFIGKTEESRSISLGDLGEGLHIDSFRTEKSPFVTQQPGAHFSDKKTETTCDAEMIDTPGFQIWDSDSAEMTATTSAVATKGRQAGAFYGAVRWGWTRAEKKSPTKIEMTATTSPLPGGTQFKAIAGLWDASKTSGNESTEHLPTVDVKFTTKQTRVVLDPAKPKASGSFYLDINTEVQVTEVKDPKNAEWQNVIIASGKHIGERGWVSEPLSDIPAPVPKSKSKP